VWLPVILVCSVFIGPMIFAHAAEENKDKSTSSKNFEETKRDLKKTGEKIEKAITEGASTLAQKIKKAFSPKEK
jgi:hypothetical protein